MQALGNQNDTISEVEVHGICDERFTRVRDLLAAQLTTGADVGASAAVFIDGEPVVDIWGASATKRARAPGNATPSSTTSPRQRR
jgi:hypothetical protein